MNRMLKLAACTVVLFSLLTAQKAQPQLANSPWPMYGHDAGHTFSSPYKGPDSIKIAWTFQLGGISYVHLDPQITACPTIGTDGTIYVTSGRSSGSPSGETYLHAISRSGTLEWKTKLGTGTCYTPVIGLDGTIYVVAEQDYYGEGYLWAISKVGGVKWKSTIGAVTGSSPAIGPDGTIYVGIGKRWSWDKQGVRAFNPGGSVKWTFETPSEIVSSPAVSKDGTIYFGTVVPVNVDPLFRAVKPDGTLKWQFNAGYSSACSPRIDATGTIYFGAYAKLYALTSNGSVKWSIQEYNLDPVAIGRDGTVFCVESASSGWPYYKFTLSAIDAEGGGVKWRYTYPLELKTGEYDRSALVDSTGTIYVAADKTVLAINADGTLKWRYDKLPDYAYTIPVLGQYKDIYICAGTMLCALMERPWEGPPDTPRRLSAAPGHTQVTLTWSPNAEKDLAYYTIYRSLASGFVPSPNDSVAKVNAPDTTYLDSGLRNGTIYYYRICAVDSTGKKSEFTAQVSATPTFNPNFLLVASPTHGAFVNTTPILVKGIAITPHVKKVEINGTQVPIVNDSFETSIHLNEGANQIRVVGYDSLNIMAREIKLTVKLDATPPLVKITTPGSGQSFSYSPIKVQGTVTDNNLVSIDVNGVKAKRTGGSFVLGENEGEGLEIEEGWRWIKATANDSAGNVGVDSVRIQGNPPSPKRLYLKADNLSWFPFPPYPPNTTMGYSTSIIVDQQTWRFPLTGDISGSTYSFSLLAGCYGAGSATMKADLILRHAETDLLLGSTPEFTGSMAGSTPYGYFSPSRKDFSITGLDPSSTAGDTLILKVTKTGGDRLGLIFIRELNKGHSWITIPEVVTGVKEEPVRTIVPSIFELSQNYPNPFNPETLIQYQLPKQADVRLKIYDLLGELVKTLVDEKQPAGYYTRQWDGRDEYDRPVASGVYLYRFTAAEFVQVRKMILVR